MTKKLLEIKADPDLCASLAWSLFPIREYLKRKPPKNSEEARDCRASVEPIFDLMDQIKCPYVKSFKKETLGLCKVK